jgi:NAD(P)-dependent dehydrogenase (short-subunit alcohol dehydrogenase family)
MFRILLIFLCLFATATVGALDLGLSDKRALVTGSTRGIGYAIARELLQEGAEVIINGRTQESVDRAIASLREETGRTPLGLPADMSTAEGTQAMFDAYPDIDILVNNVGTYGPSAFEQSTDEDWYRLFDLNVMSGVRLSRLYLPGMREQDWGRIIFISSESAYHIPADSIHYGMSKAAQIAVSRGLAEATAETGITVNTVLPGPTRTEAADGFLRAQAESGADVREVERQFFVNARPTSLIMRFADPAEVAAMVAYVVSERASATTGAVLRVDGGTVKTAF